MLSTGSQTSVVCSSRRPGITPSPPATPRRLSPPLSVKLGDSQRRFGEPLVLSAATTAPTAGSGDNLTITATDQYGNTDPTYTGSHNLTFSGGTTIGSFVPTVTNSSGTAVNFGSTTAINFSSGVATVSGSSNGAMTLYKASSQSITTTDGTLNTTTPLVVTVAPAGAASFAVTNPGPVTAGTAFNLTVTALDTYGNTATGYTGSKSLTFTGASNSPNNTAPTVAGTAFGSATSVSFSSGVATPLVILTKAQPTAITATQSSIAGTLPASPSTPELPPA